MFRITKELEVSGSHCLDLPYDSKCTNLHGHNWMITVEISGESLNKDGMLLDFVSIKEIVGFLDHKDLNKLFDFNPTAENIALWIAMELDKHLLNEWKGVDKERPFVSKVEIQESRGNTACYIPSMP